MKKLGFLLRYTLTQENIVVLKYSRKINSPEIIVGEDLNI